jgi:hypothetical protein
MLVSLMKKHVPVPGMSLIPWKRLPHSFPKPRCQRGLETGILHECHVFYFFSGDGLDDSVGLVLLRPMVGSQGDGHVRSVHAA